MKQNFISALALQTVLFLAICSFMIVLFQTKRTVQSGLLITFLGDYQCCGIPDAAYFASCRKYHTVILGNDSSENMEQIEFARKSLNAIKNAKDQKHGIHFVLDAGATYNDFIKAINACMDKRPWYFVPYRNHIYAAYIAPRNDR